MVSRAVVEGVLRSLGVRYKDMGLGHVGVCRDDLCALAEGVHENRAYELFLALLGDEVRGRVDWAGKDDDYLILQVRPHGRMESP